MRTAHHAIKIALTAVALAATICGTTVRSLSQARDQSVAERKVITRIEPEYPDTLKRLYIGGVVRVEIVVSGNGNVQTAELLGGNPILGQSAMKAIKQWKYEPGSKEKLIVQLEFDPHR